jgi:RNA-directed DNA polymerase
MKESYGEDLASHTDPESCAVARKGGREALTGVCAGELLSREITMIRGADAVPVQQF